MSRDNQYDEYRAFLDRIPQIRLMVRDILRNPAPISEQRDILKKLKILNYALDEWDDEYDRMQHRHTIKNTLLSLAMYHSSTIMKSSII